VKETSNIQSIEALRQIYDEPKGRAKDKVLHQLEKHSKHFIRCSPFAVISTVSSQGQMDVSPRGGATGFISIENDTTLLLPDYKGNNRLDSLGNIIETGSIGILFLIPGIDETLRVNGTATITTSPSILSKFDQEKKPPISCTIVTIEEVFLHCAKAFMRSNLWDTSSQTNPKEFPTIGVILNDQVSSKDTPESREEMIKRYQKDL
jgi:PPOX class probable FMN-dependent enzyme